MARVSISLSVAASEGRSKTQEPSFHWAQATRSTGQPAARAAGWYLTSVAKLANTADFKSASYQGIAGSSPAARIRNLMPNSSGVQTGRALSFGVFIWSS